VSKKLADVERQPGRPLPGEHGSRETMGAGGAPVNVVTGVVASSAWVDGFTRVDAVVVVGSTGVGSSVEPMLVCAPESLLYPETEGG